MATKLKNEVLILMSTYNGEKNIGEQIKSIENQKVDIPIRILIRDDGSTDKTVSLLKKFKKQYKNIDFFEGKNIGCNASFFELFKLADRNYMYYSISDQDDVWLDDKIQRGIDMIKQNDINKPILYGSCSYLMGSNGIKGTTQTKIRDLTLNNSIIQNIVPGHSQILNNALFNKLKLDIDINKIYVYDFWITNVAMLYGKVIFDNTPSTKYRIHDYNTLGYGNGKINWIKERFKRFKNGDGSAISKQIKYFYDIYNKDMSELSKKEIEKYIKRNTCLIKRIAFALTTKLYRQKRIETFIFKMTYILGLFKEKKGCSKHSNVLIVLGSNIHWAPYYYRYEKEFNNLKIEFDLLIWNREGISEKTNAKSRYEFKWKDKSDNGNPLKVLKFVFFCRFVKRVIKLNKYNKIIFLGTHGCAPVFLSKFLKKKYSKKYWIDIRDYTYEWFKLFYGFEKISILNSHTTVISSPEYTAFLPKHNFFIMHNIDPNIEMFEQRFSHKEDPDSKIRISFIGNVRYYEQNKKLLSLLKNDNRFVVQFFGNGSETLKDFCKKNNILNVDFYGKFNQLDTIKFYEKTDIINNVYGNDNLNLKIALSNKLYYAVFFKIPVLVSDNTYMERLIHEYGIGFSFNDDDIFADELYKWYNKLDKKSLNKRFNILKNKFIKEDSAAVSRLREFILSDIRNRGE